MTSITPREFALFQRLMHESAGIHLSDSKHALVSGRLAQRLRVCGVQSYGQYFQLLTRGGSSEEREIAVDLLTTHETYFFREPRHFEFLRARLDALGDAARPFRVWSAATSSGEEAYSIAMVLEDTLPGGWEVVGSDLSALVLARAQAGRYPLQRLSAFPAGYLRRFCLKGVGARAGLLQVAPRVREPVQWRRINLNEPLPGIGLFDLVFLRNVLIYFDVRTQREVLARVIDTLKPGGHLLIGHSETLSGVTEALERLAPAIYRKPAQGSAARSVRPAAACPPGAAKLA